MAVLGLFLSAHAGWNGPVTLQSGRVFVTASGWSISAFTTTPSPFTSAGIPCRTLGPPCGNSVLWFCESYPSTFHGTIPNVTVMTLSGDGPVGQNLTWIYSSNGLNQTSCPGPMQGFSGSQGVTFGWDQRRAIASFTTSMSPSILIATFALQGQEC